MLWVLHSCPDTKGHVFSASRWLSGATKDTLMHFITPHHQPSHRLKQCCSSFQSAVIIPLHHSAWHSLKFVNDAALCFWLSVALCLMAAAISNLNEQVIWCFHCQSLLKLFLIDFKKNVKKNNFFSVPTGWWSLLWRHEDLSHLRPTLSISVLLGLPLWWN